MREYAKKPENKSRTLDSNPRASRQAPISEILQAYQNRTFGKPVQRQEIDDDELLQSKSDVAQREELGEDELIQPKFDTVQREELDDDELMQPKFESASATEQTPIQREEKRNNTGLPDDLKSGIESLSGYSMDDVRVHYNSGKPAQLQAFAYAQGADIHVAPGQEQHLPHEAWHVVQQKQGRVQPTMQMQGVNVNDNEGLEREADVMGGKALDNSSCNYKRYNNATNTTIIIQRVLEEADKEKANDFFDFKIREIGNPYTIRNTKIRKWIIRVSSNLDEAKMMINHCINFYKSKLDEMLSDSEDTKLQKEYTEELFERLLELKLSFSSKADDDFTPNYAILTTSQKSEMKKLFSGMKESRSLILGLIDIAPDLFTTLFAENSIEETKEDMPYYHHSQMVMNQFDKYFASKNDSKFIDDTLMRVMLMFHDINKQRSLKQHGKIGEHMDTVDAIQEICKDVLDEDKIKIISVMTSADPFGSFFKEIDQIREFHKTQPCKKTENELIEQARQRCCDKILVLANKAEIPPANKEVFFDRYVQFYQSDFSAYSGHALFTDECYKQPKTGEDSTRLYQPSFNTCFFKLKKGHELEIDAQSGFLKFSKDGWDEELISLKNLFLGSDFERDYSPIITEEAQNEKMRKEFESRKYSQKESEYIDFGELIYSIYKSKKDETKLYDEITRISKLKEDEVGYELQEKCKCLLELQIEAESDDLVNEFEKTGLFIRKIWPEYDSTGTKNQESVRVKLQKEIDTIYEHILKEPISPYVLPSTLVKSGIPINLTDAQGGLLHASGIIYSGDTKLAPSSKEHNESAQLSSVLNERVRERIHSHETWRSIVRHVIDKTGGKSYDTREELVNKMQEMEDRRSGISPDFSTKELMLKTLECVDDNFSFTESLWQDKIQKMQSDTVKGQLQKRFLLYLDGKESITCKELKDKCKKDITRKDRTHSIYGGGKRSLEKGNRYFKSDKSGYFPLKASSEASGYDGYTFQTNEALLLPDSLDLLKGIYVNEKSVASLFHALNLAREFYLHTDRKAPLLTYDSYLDEKHKGIMKNITIKDIIDKIEKELKDEDDITDITSLLIKKSEKSTGTTPTIKESTVTIPTTKESTRAFLLAFTQRQLKFLPDQTSPKKR